MAKITLIQFQPDSTPQSANKALKLAVKCRAKAEHCIALWFKDIIDRKLYKELGYSSIYLYGEKELGLSQSRTGDFKRLAEKLESLPALQKELETGRIGYTKAREIIKVAQTENENQWLHEAHNSTRDELAGKVKRARQEARKNQLKNPRQRELIPMPPLPTLAAAMTHKVSLEMTSIQLARYESLWEKLFKAGCVPAGSKKVEVLLEAMADLVGNTDKNTDSKFPCVSPVQIHVRRCPTCNSTTLSTGRGEVPLTDRELEHLSCDAQIYTEGKTNRATVAPSVKREVIGRANHQCQTPGCRNTRFLEVHHIKPRKSGGSNKLSNLQCLCSSCHAQLHRHEWRPEKYPPGVVNPSTPAAHPATQTKPQQQLSQRAKCEVRE